jgi:hypothetical protein
MAFSGQMKMNKLKINRTINHTTAARKQRLKRSRLAVPPPVNVFKLQSQKLLETPAANALAVP